MHSQQPNVTGTNAWESLQNSSPHAAKVIELARVPAAAIHHRAHERGYAVLMSVPPNTHTHLTTHNTILHYPLVLHALLWGRAIGPWDHEIGEFKLSLLSFCQEKMQLHMAKRRGRRDPSVPICMVHPGERSSLTLSSLLQFKPWVGMAALFILNHVLAIQCEESCQHKPQTTDNHCFTVEVAQPTWNTSPELSAWPY